MYEQLNLKQFIYYKNYSLNSQVIYDEIFKNANHMKVFYMILNYYFNPNNFLRLFTDIFGIYILK